MASVTIKGGAKSFGRAGALSGIDLTVPDGEFCVIAGPSGAGKSTLLRAIAGLDHLDAGTIEVDGEAVNDWQPHQRDVAMLFQKDALFPAMSVYNNIAFSLKARRTPRAEIEPRVRRIAELLAIADLLESPMHQLSDAQRRRTAIARAFVRDAGLCLLDEPLGNVEAELRDQMRAEIKLLHREFPTTLLYVTNDPIEAMTLADRTVLMRGGQVEQEGTPLALFERPETRFVAGFFGWPKMNFLTGALSRDASGDVIRLAAGETSVKLPPNRLPKELADGAPLILGLRPEHMMRAVRASPPDGVFRHEAEIEVLRPIGSRTYATFRIGGAAVVAELLAHDVSRPGDRIPIDVNLKRATIFDALSEKAL
jgi:multiple sugar transport system ATP-binding protein